jgi:hypothetical protein
MAKKGSGFIRDPHRGLLHREDFDKKCHVEVNEEVNAWLLRHATMDPDQHEDLKLVGVNIDGGRRDPNSYVCFWHPELRALRLKNKLFHTEIGSAEGLEAAKFHEHYGWVKNLRGTAYGKVKIQALQQEVEEEETKNAQERQEEWERQAMERDC